LSATGPCNRFQANIFNKTKCQNCFKSRELHLLNDHDMEQAKPIYGGWLCLAPEGTDFDNPMQRSRKWQRRFFILYEHGSLSFALDELPSTLPQGTVNMNLCTDITDAEPRTSQRNALCIATPEQEIFIRGDNKEIINGWSEQLAAYIRTNKQNQKKKRKVEPVTALSIYYTLALTCHFNCCFALSSQPDLLNFKKGWMVKLDGNDQWKKYWFVLSTDSLRYYKDSVAEEASDLEGEIDLTKCYNVSEYQVQRNYGFQIHTLNGVYTLSAMTAGIRKNWIQALMKNVHPGNAPDVASLPAHHHVSCSLPEALPKPDVTQDSLSTEIPTERHPHPKPKSVMERRREGRYKTFDWAEYRPQNKQTLETDLQRTKPPFTLELGDSDRKKRREERRRRYESMLGFSLGWEETEHQTVDGSVRAWSPKSQETVEEEIEECWKQVEKTRHECAKKADEYLLQCFEATETRLTELERQLDQSELTCSELQEQNSELTEAEKLSLVQSDAMSLNQEATCERAFASIQESHLKVVEELQHRHQQEVERLIVERDLLLEEESAATATAIEAIKNAHRLELERELQKRCQSENSSGNTYLEDTYRQHREELASCQRELEVLSQQFSLKCLENVHLVQALDAERKALCQCQQENQDLRTRNQELNGHLAAEITRLCSLAKHDNLPPSQGMDVYEMEITLRVKESEVQCLKQEITSLKEELQSAQRDKRNATKKYKDMYTELSIVRVKTEREMDELRENLRLAHQALGHTSP
uniref:Myosin phosphatase Rho-interacting protein-like n=1 Tax=Mastacembelus armatus TaxID=205130 RepID=A0A7N8WJC9_9TELE